MPQSQEALAVSLRVLSCPFGSHFQKPADRASALEPNCVPILVPRRCPKSIEEGIHHFDVRKIGGYWAYFFISEETNRREMLVEDLVSCAYQKSHSAAFTNGTLLHCAQNLPQYQFARDRVLSSILFFPRVELSLLSGNSPVQIKSRSQKSAGKPC